MYSRMEPLGCRCVARNACLRSKVKCERGKGGIRGGDMIALVVVCLDVVVVVDGDEGTEVFLDLLNLFLLEGDGVGRCRCKIWSEES